MFGHDCGTGKETDPKCEYQRYFVGVSDETALDLRRWYTKWINDKDYEAQYVFWRIVANMLPPGFEEPWSVRVKVTGLQIVLTEEEEYDYDGRKIER